MTQLTIKTRVKQQGKSLSLDEDKRKEAFSKSSELCIECELIYVDGIACKAIRFPMIQPKNGKYFVTPLLMS